MNTTSEDVQPPWYRQAWPWFLISIPASSIVMGFVMLTLALQTNNSLVVDDYYKEGKAINQRIERDRMAAQLGLGALVRNEGQGIRLALTQSAPDNSFRLPAELELRWVHVTQAAKDGATILTHIGSGQYIAENVALPQFGQWRVHIQAPGADWRLVSERIKLLPDSAITLEAGQSNTSGKEVARP